MIKFKVFGIQFKVSFLFLCLICWFFLNSKQTVALIYFFSSLFHEIFHILAFLICSVKIDLISFTVFGISIFKKQQIQFKKEFLILIFGCLGNLTLVLIFLILNLKLVVFVNLFILIFNILPFEKFDGGAIFKLILERFLNFKTAFKICKVASNAVGLILFLFSALTVFYFKNKNILFAFFLFLLSPFFEF